MNKTVRIGVVGCGSVASGPYTNLIDSLRARGQAEVVMACDIKEDKARALADHHRIDRVTTRYQDVLGAPDVDVVLVATSMNEHGPITKAALQAGKHVLVEKPMATSLDEAAELVELANGGPGTLVCAPHVYLSRTYQEMWRRIQGGEIGTPFTARARYGWHPGPWWGKWFFQKGGGALFDLGVYNVTALFGFLGPAKRVTAMTGAAIPERTAEGEVVKTEAEDNAHVLIDFGNSVFAVVTTGFTMPGYRSPCIEIYGSKGVIQMLGDDWAPEGFELYTKELNAWQIHDAGDRHWPWTDGMRQLVECVQTGRPPINRPEHAYHALEIMLAAQAAGKDGRAREIKSTIPELDLWDGKRPKSAELAHDRTRAE
jgi:predicted dehydrogenase